MASLYVILSFYIRLVNWGKQHLLLQESIQNLPTIHYYMAVFISPFVSSVTEDEITRGILTADAPEKHCHWFRRTITDILDNTSATKAPRFMDVSRGKVDKEAKQLLDRLKYVLQVDLFYNIWHSSIKKQLTSSWTHQFDILHNSVQTTLGSVEQLISSQNYIPPGILGTDCFFMDPSVVCTELWQKSNGWVLIWGSKLHREKQESCWANLHLRTMAHLLSDWLVWYFPQWKWSTSIFCMNKFLPWYCLYQVLLPMWWTVHLEVVLMLCSHIFLWLYV